jgi:SAM-dependent methyltransferase
MAVDPAQQQRYWSQPGKRRDPRHPAVEAFARPKVELVVRALAPAPGERPSLLEVGAGNGHLSVYLDERFDLTCLDFSPAMLEQNPLPAARKVEGDARALGFADRSFDVVLCANLLHHLAEPAAAVREMRRVARRFVVLIEPNATNPLMFLFAAIVPAERGALRFDARHLESLASAAGLRRLRFHTHGAVTPNATPALALPLLRPFDREQPLGFYHVGIFAV